MRQTFYHKENGALVLKTRAEIAAILLADNVKTVHAPGFRYMHYEVNGVQATSVQQLAEYWTTQDMLELENEQRLHWPVAELGADPNEDAASDSERVARKQHIDEMLNRKYPVPGPRGIVYLTRNEFLPIAREQALRMQQEPGFDASTYTTDDGATVLDNIIQDILGRL